MNNTNEIINTYNKLKSGNEDYLEALDYLVEYKVTNGRLQSQVEIYLNRYEMVMRFYLYTALIFLTSISSLCFLQLFPLHPLFPPTISLSITLYGITQLVYLVKYSKKSKIYNQVFDFVNSYEPGTLEEIYEEYQRQNED